MSGSDRAERAADLHAELGYRTSGLREIKQRDWFSLRGNPDEPLPAPTKFDAEIRRLYHRRWKAAHPDLWKEYQRKREAKATRKATHIESEMRRYRIRKAAGLCVKCEAPTATGHSACETCRRHVQQQRKALKESRRLSVGRLVDQDNGAPDTGSEP